ncbi:hypothetical protein [Thioalkalivibrio sp. XN279]|uniref:hypothetical protein n=1 Tax=Thioalkalivibrio sp. XN279 TaxID=2714953 RepID=UPI0014096012|nr:hypothetical protein [Thioalkalivibrio sp. XN279]NHA15176.1 hypothetical protein [Thioalkalivibrio sp. XN279]
MSQRHAKVPQYLARLAWIGALVLVLRFVGAELHHVLETHGPGETCEACLVLERGGQALPAPGFASLVPLRANADPVFLPAPTAVAPALTPLPRGPPRLSS